MRAFSDADLVQSNASSATLTASQAMTVASGVAEGNAGIICTAVQLPITPPEQWHIAAVPSGGLLDILCRADLPGGESSWTISAVTTCNWAWSVGEWANVSSAPIESAVSNLGTGGASSVTTGTTSSFTTEFVMGIAAFGMTSAGGAVWPSVSYNNGFTETDSQSSGDGTHSGDILLKVARLYGADGDTGPWSCTATFTGSMASKTPFAALVVFRGEETAGAPVGVITG